MENRFNHLPPEENQGWGAYLTPPSPPGQSNIEANARNAQTGLCLRVREMLPALVENDADVRPEMASAIYGHLAVCAACTLEYEAQQRVVFMLESLEDPEMPMDFSAMIMQQIQAGTVMADMPRRDVVKPPFAAESSVQADVSSVAGDNRLHTGLHSDVVAPPIQTTATQETHQVTHSLVQEETLTTASIRVWERWTIAGMLTAVMAFFLRSDWGVRLGYSVESVGELFSQIGNTLKQVPLFGVLVTYILIVLMQVGNLLEQTYRAMGPMAVQGLALDIAIFATAYYFLVTRRQRGQMHGA